MTHLYIILSLFVRRDKYYLKFQFCRTRTQHLVRRSDSVVNVYFLIVQILLYFLID